MAYRSLVHYLTEDEGIDLIMEGTEKAQPDKPTIMMLMNNLVPRQVSHSGMCVSVCVCIAEVTYVSLQNSSTPKKKWVSRTLATPTTCILVYTCIYCVYCHCSTLCVTAAAATCMFTVAGLYTGWDSLF